jgi:hypothetical protein
VYRRGTGQHGGQKVGGGSMTAQQAANKLPIAAELAEASRKTVGRSIPATGGFEQGSDAVPQVSMFCRFRTATNTNTPYKVRVWRGATSDNQHWCHACGRWQKHTQAGSVLPVRVSAAGYVAQTFTFRLHSHDPARASLVRTVPITRRKPEWTYNEQEMEEALSSSICLRRPYYSREYSFA